MLLPSFAGMFRVLSQLEALSIYQESSSTDGKQRNPPGGFVSLRPIIFIANSLIAQMQVLCTNYSFAVCAPVDGSFVVVAD